MRINWTEKLGLRKVLGLLAALAIYLTVRYGLTEYYYTACPVPYSAYLGAAIPFLFFAGFFLLNVSIVRKLPWYSGRENSFFFVSVLASLACVVLLSIYWCR